ncbi:MAG: polysaccharide biosynthesis tyrosine autokinase [Methylococcaceae bacterium]|nr:polysaccharide biosynthesis tyrosine autokinase [Methylococcaceae bacterium]
MTDKLSTINQPHDFYQNQDDDEIDLRQILGILLDSKWLIGTVLATSVLLGLAKALLSSPIYMADAMLQIEESSQPLGALEPMEALLGTGQIPVEAEIEIVKSRRVLGEVVKNLDLEIIAEPKYFPVFGKSIARNFKLRNKNKISAPLFGYLENAWGGELIKIETFNVPFSFIGEKLTLISGKKGLFKLFDENQQLIFEGKVGEQVTKKSNDEEGEFNLFVSLLKARPGTAFTLIRKPYLDVIDDINEKLSVAEKGKLTGILDLTLESESPLLAMKVLNEIVNTYVQMNVEQKSAEAQNTLEFLDKQLPMIKNQLEAATTALNEYRLQKGSVDLNIETQGVLQGVVEKRTQITLLQQKRDELRRGFTSAHPTVVAIDKQINRLEVQMGADNKKITELPETQQVILRLSRDVQVNSELYTTLLNHLQTIKVAKAGTVGDVRVIDHAVLPKLPVRPKKVLIVAVSLILGLVLGLMLALVRKAMSRGVEDPDIIEKQLNIPVYATVPHSDIQKKLSKGGNDDEVFSVLAVEDTDDMAIESLRSLRTTLHFAFLEAKNNIIMITGPSPGIGKSFISTNLAFVLANTGKKILLIDGDLRKGYINKALGLKRENGLSDLISNNISIEEAIRTIETTEGNIDFIPTGDFPPNPSELLLHERFDRLLEALSDQYDQIIIDSPPVLAVTDACIVGRLASVTLMVVKAGVHPLRELEQSVKRLKQNDVNIKGVVFNDLSASASAYGYGGYVYQYSYQNK